MTKEEQALMSEAPTTAVCPRGAANCGVATYGSGLMHVRDSEKWTCTLMRGHVGPHIAHEYANIPARVWKDEERKSADYT